MEVNSNGPETRVLTPLRLLRGVCCLLVLLSTAFVILVYFGFFTAVIVRLFSIHYSRQSTAFFFGSWLALWPFLFEKINKTKVVFSGESVPANERVLIIANHRTEVDWMYLWDLALRKGRLGYIKYVLKKSLMKLPVFGWAFQILEFISVERKWEVDESSMRQMLSTFNNYEDPLWLAVFPEGTDFTEQKCIRSQKFASEKGLPILHNVLLPKTKGFAACLEELRGSLDAVYDITIGYKNRCPTFFDNACGVAPSEVHIHVRRIIVDDIPTSEETVGSWLMETFSKKDQMLSDFHLCGCFPHQGTEEDLPMIPCLVNVLGGLSLHYICGGTITILSAPHKDLSFAKRKMLQLNDQELILVTVSVANLAMLWYKFMLSSSSKGAPSLPPGPRWLPIVGYLPFLTPDLHKQFTNMANIYGPIFKVYLGTSKLYVVINTPELAKAVVRDQDEAFSNRDQTVAPLVISYGGQDLVVSKNNSHWRKLRKIFVHEVMSNKSLEACGCFRRDQVRKTITNVFSNIGKPINISEIAFMTEANVMTSMIFDTTLDHFGDSFGAELKLVSAKIVEIFGKPNLSDFFPSLAWFDLQGVERDMKKQRDKLDHIFTSIIEERIKSSSTKSQDGLGQDDGKKDFLQILLDLKNKEGPTSLNITQIKALILDIIVAGTETTATLIEWAMAEIMRNNRVMKKVQEELSSIVGVNNHVQESHLPKLQYLDATVKETFRLHPVLPFILPRVPSQDCIVGGYTIPKGTSVFLNVWSIHRDPRYWDNPLEFNPERFLACEGTNQWDYKGNNLKFLPFGSGRRLCPGIPLAEKMQMFILASLLHLFDWSLPKGEEHDFSERFGITLRKIKPLVASPSQRFSDVSLYN